MARAAALLGSLGLALASRAAGATPNERIAVEILKGETPRQAALAFEQACYRLGVSALEARPAQLFLHQAVPYVRLSVEGPPLVSRCLNLLEKGRRGVSGAIHWFDGFAGGEVVNGGLEEDRVPDAEWFSPAAAKLPAPVADPALAKELEHGSADALARLDKLDLDVALAQVDALIAQTGPGPLATLEQIARKHPHWRVRRAATEALNPFVSLPALIEIARTDPAWEVRIGAVALLQPAANTQQQDAAKLVIDRLQHDVSWEVRRQALWNLSTELVEDAKDVIRQTLRNDPEPQVRAAALEVLAGGRVLTHGEARTVLRDSSPIVRAVAASALAREMSETDAPVLWQALNDPERIVRIAAAAFLTRLTDASIGPQLWQLYLREADQVDSDPAYERTVLEALARAPYGGLAGQVQQRLSTMLPPDERRLLSRLLARLDPKLALALLAPDLSSTEALTRSIAADAAPSAPQVAERRLALLADPETDVRAGAVLGLCRGSPVDAAVRESLSHVELSTTPLGQEAALALPRCGQPETTMPFIHTALAAAGTEPMAHTAFWPAIGGIVLMLVSVFAIKLAHPPSKD
jgi:hypothetical protein